MKMQPFDRVSNQVLAYALSSGPKMSTSRKGDSLAARFYGDALCANNAAYDRSRRIALEEGIMVKNSQGLYELGPVGHDLLVWAEEKGMDLSLVKTKAALQASR